MSFEYCLIIMKFCIMLKIRTHQSFIDTSHSAKCETENKFETFKNAISKMKNENSWACVSYNCFKTAFKPKFALKASIKFIFKVTESWQLGYFIKNETSYNDAVLK